MARWRLLVKSGLPFVVHHLQISGLIFHENALHISKGIFLDLSTNDSHSWRFAPYSDSDGKTCFGYDAKR